MKQYVRKYFSHKQLSFISLLHVKNISKLGFYTQGKKFTLKRGKRDQAMVHYSE